jgi:agmatine/peptidylarginine deiminase
LSEAESVRRDSAWAAANPHSLPRWETLEEKRIKSAYFAQRRRMSRAFPPLQAPLRYVAEYERMAGVLIRYPFGISVSLIREMAADAAVYCLVQSSQQSAARSALQNGNVDLSRVVFISAPTDSYWTRDYTPWPVFDGNGRPALVDFTYNRPRRDDDAAAGAVGKALGLPLAFMDLVHAGGNFMGDGFAVGASTDLVYAENDSIHGIGAREVDGRIAASLGVDEYAVRPDPTGAAIKHIDTWGKFLAPDKVLIRRVPQSHPRYAEIEQAASYFAGSTSAYGGRYRIFRVDTPNNEPYTNSLILNDKVLVPGMGTSRDAAALQAIRQAMPGYRVLGFAGSWISTDALHCRTFGIFDSGLLHISHIPLRDTLTPVAGSFQVQADIVAHSGQGLIPDSLLLFHKAADQDVFTRAVLTPAGGSRYRGWIPGPKSDIEMQYYLHAADSSGRSENHSFIGAPDPHRFYARVAPVGIAGGKRPGGSRSTSWIRAVRGVDALGRAGKGTR